ncbi:hypothetical protein AB1285_22505 [Microbacterium sp. NRRL B-14842]|uniref:hypothetical protein n=1 Tax=Microbacterium TaxID=33882 RepID=UPI0003A8BD7E|nr:MULTISPECIES: hypothetical protein [unclassified Microbacterium]KYJ98576.1 hypothetical protein AUV07_00955 [Microbacterium sp. CH1]MBS1696957.1 hypothetical protein [Actinomycetota bacterium]
MADRDEEREVARFYTRSRRFPKFIGRLHDGTKIPGGPYTLTQGVVLAIVLVVALMTQSVWGTGSPIVDIPVAAFVSWGAAWGAGRIPATRRNLLSIITSGMSAMTRPAAGRYRGVTMRVRPPHFAGGGTTIAEPVGATLARPDSENTAPAPEAPVVAQPVLQPRSTPLPAHAPAHAVSGVERLLQQARGGN